jgi:hypothetical protein
MNKVDKAQALLASILHGPASTCILPTTDTQTEDSRRSAAHFTAQLQAACTLLEAEEVLDTIEAQFQRGGLSQTELEELHDLAVKKSRVVPMRFEDMALNTFARCGRVLTVKSKVLDEIILWVADNADVPKSNSLVVYRASELKVLIGTPNTLRAQHMIKKMFDGEVMPTEPTEY